MESKLLMHKGQYKCQATSVLVKSPKGFTIIELIAVMTIMIAMSSLAVMAVNQLKNAGDLTRVASSLAGIFEQGRAYAMANNTYVFVGLTEVDASVSASSVPQIPSSNSAGGRIAVAIAASQNGTRNYDPASLSGVTTLSASALIALTKLYTYENMHILDFSGMSPPSSGGMQRNSVSTQYSLGNSSSYTATQFTWPVGATTAKYVFDRVIQFDPQGAASIAFIGGASTPQWIELGLQATHGNSIPALPLSQTVGNMAAIQIDGVSGAVRTYRP